MRPLDTSPDEWNRTGFISDYSTLQRLDDQTARYISPELAEYHSYIVDPVRSYYQMYHPVFTPQERLEIANYMRAAIEDVLRDSGYIIASRPGVGVAQVRLAITHMLVFPWYVGTMPDSRIFRIGGASLEVEVIDSVTDRQLAALVQSNRMQHEVKSFTALSDIKDVIDKWAKQAGERIDELHGRTKK